MYTALIFNDAHIGSKLIYESPYSECHADNGAVESISNLIRYGNDIGACRLISNGDAATLKNDFQSCIAGSQTLLSLAQTFNGEFDMGVGNHEAFWGLEHIKANPETHTIDQEAFPNTDIILAPPSIEISPRGLIYSPNEEKVIEEIRASTASNLAIVTHYTCLRDTAKGSLTVEDPYRFNPEDKHQQIRTELEKHACQGGRVFQISGDEHAFFDRVSPAGVRYIVIPALTQNNSQDRSKPCEIFGELQETDKGELLFSFRQNEHFWERGIKGNRIITPSLETLREYCKSKFSPEGFKTDYANLPQTTAALQQAHGVPQP